MESSPLDESADTNKTVGELAVTKEGSFQAEHLVNGKGFKKLVY